MTPQTRFADGTQTLFIGNAVFAPFRQPHGKTIDVREVIYQALKEREMRSIEEVAFEINLSVYKVKHLFIEMIAGGEFAIYKIWQPTKKGCPRTVYTTLKTNFPGEPSGRLRALMCDGRARSIKATMLETGMAYKTINKYFRALVLTDEFTVQDGKLANGHMASVYRMKT